MRTTQICHMSSCSLIPNGLKVINLKLKSNGIFWLQENCERMLYLRCQFLTTRWGIFEEKLDLMRLNLYEVNELEKYSDAA